MKVSIVCGTRPEILKFAPIIKELKAKQIKHKVFFTSQHFTTSMGSNFFKELGIEVSKSFKGKFDREKVMEWLKQCLREYSPDIVLVQGDTKSAMIGAMAAAFSGIQIGHVEAGLRSFDFKEPFPEEYYRTLIDSISTFLFCPTKANYNNTLVNGEIYGVYGIRPNRKVYITGNTIIDLVNDRCKNSYSPKKQILITIHRRENWNRMKNICYALNVLSRKHDEYEFVFVKHANKKLATNIKEFLKESKIKLIDPQPYFSFLKLLQESYLVITDSGGLVEEASVLGVPLVMIREKTERMEAVKNGNAILAGTEPVKIITEVESALNDDKKWNRMHLAKCPFGNGFAAKRIVDILQHEIQFQEGVR